MKEAPADSSAPGGLKPQAGQRYAGGSAAQKPPGERWSWQRWLAMVAVVFAAQLALIFALGERQFPPPLAVSNVPRFTLADSTNVLLALNDPTLFALPHADDFAPLAYSNSPPDFRWKEPPGEMPLAAENLGADFARYMQTNPFAAQTNEFKPPAKLSEPDSPPLRVFAEKSSVRVEGGLAQRKWLNPVDLTNWPYADVIVPSRVQVLVDALGNVVSAVLLPPDNPGEAAGHYDAADARALELARTGRFSPAPNRTVGQLVFDWCAVPPPATNSPAGAP